MLAETSRYHRGMRVIASSAAEDTVEAVLARGRSDLTMVLSNGCCDATAPYLYDRYLPDPQTTPVGEIAGVPVLAPSWLARMYPDDEELLVDVETGMLDDSFSLETELDRRFVLRAAPSARRAAR